MELYIVHMKKVTASEARKNWFRLLDEAASGEVVVIERNGKRLVLKEEKLARDRPERSPQYSRLLRVSAPDEADLWSWKWSESPRRLRLSRKRKK